jgi:hypothetical protein
MIVRMPLIAALAASLVLPVLARAETVVAICRTGGCDCALSPLSQDEIALVVGLPNDPAASTLVYEPALEALSWVTAPRRDIQASFGGTGDCPVDPAAAHQALTPRDGTWRCAKFGHTLTKDDQHAGAHCPEHRFLPSLVPGDQVDADEFGITYARPNGPWVDRGPVVEVAA